MASWPHHGGPCFLNPLLPQPTPLLLLTRSHTQGANLQQCAAAGCAAGAKAVQAEGAELTPESWQWLQDEITRILAEDKVLVGANGVNGTH